MEQHGAGRSGTHPAPSRLVERADGAGSGGKMKQGAMSPSIVLGVCAWAMFALPGAKACGGARQDDADAGATPPRSAAPFSPCSSAIKGGTKATCAVPGFEGREYDVHLPPAYDGASPIPVVFAFHGGSGNRTSMHTFTCSEGKAGGTCLTSIANARGYAVVMPNGTPIGPWLRADLRAWYAGGGVDGYRCVGEPTCEKDSRDEAYIRAVLDDLARRVTIDEKRIYATGHSNGGAFTHRVACQLSDRFAAIAAVSGAMQWTVNEVCKPDRAIPVLHVHGTADKCWSYTGGPPPGCANGQPGLAHVSVERTMAEWAANHGCDGTAPKEETLPDTEPLDGTRTTRRTWSGCSAPLVELRVEGMGHTWPGGQDLPLLLGRVVRDWDSNLILDFFEGK